MWKLQIITLTSSYCLIIIALTSSLFSQKYFAKLCKGRKQDDNGQNLTMLEVPTFIRFFDIDYVGL